MRLSAETAERIAGMMELAFLGEAQRRIYLAMEAKPLGRGGVAAVAEAAGVSEGTVRAGLRDLEDPEALRDTLGQGRSRRPGGGRKASTEEHPAPGQLVLSLVDEATYGDPGRDVAHAIKSVRNVAEQASAILSAEEGREVAVSHETVRGVLAGNGYSTRGNKKCLQVGEPHPDRDAQFLHIAGRIDLCLSEGLPVISVDTKKKELLGGFAAAGREWGARGTHVCAGDHDFMDRDLGKAVPYGVYDVGRNEGFVGVGNSADTSDFAVASTRAWWDEVGRYEYPGADRILVTCDGGGSNGHRCRLWKLDLQLFADRNGLQVEVCHYPAGNSKFNKVERRLFSHISMGWRGQPLTSLEVVRNLIASTTTRTGLVVRAVIDRTVYRRGRRVADEEMASLELVRHDFRGEWNYMLRVRGTLGIVA